MSVVTNDVNNQLFKKHYGRLENAIPQNLLFEKEIPFNQSAKVGDEYKPAVILSAETGWTLAGQGIDAFDIEPAIAGVVKQAAIKPSQTVLTSIIPFAFISRSQGDENSFVEGTKHIVKNHTDSHSALCEILRIHGQSPALLGYVSFAASGTVYRGATYSGSGTVTLTLADGSTLAFTAGINAASKAILMAPGNFASGIWVGKEGAKVLQVDASNNIVASGKLVGVDSDLGFIYVDFVPVAASSTTSHRVCFSKQEQAKDMVGMKKILGNTGTLFDISASAYSLWRCSVLDLGQKRFNLTAVQKGVSLAANRGGLDKPLLIVCNPRTFANLSQDEASLRKYDASYSKKASNGFEAIEFYAPNGTNRIVPHPIMMEGDVFGLEVSSWIRSGSAEISFTVPGFGDKLIFPLESQAGYCFRSYSDQFVLAMKPAKNIYWKNCNDEGVAYQ